MAKKYNLGLDLGTSSVGWACVDENYNVIKKKGKTMWGVRLFDEAQTAKNRRIFRGNRRRLERRKERIAILNSFFEDELSKVDSNFLHRLSYSYEINDNKFVIYEDSSKNRDFYLKFPTIYHLRSYLLDSANTDFDIKMVYLAIRHILNKRGHFLFSNLSEDLKTNDIVEYYDNLRFNLSIDEFFSVINKKVTKKQKLSEIISLLRKEGKNKEREALAKLIIMGNAKFDNLSIEEDEETDAISVDFDAIELDSILEELSDENLKIKILNAYSIYSFIRVRELLGESTYVSDSMINIYNKHKEQLSAVKEYLKQKDINSYKQFFKSTSSGYKQFFKNTPSGYNYSNYVSNYISEEESKEVRGDWTKLIKTLNKLKGDDFPQQLQEDLNNGSLLKIISNSNHSSIPYQLHRAELRTILLNASAKFNFLKVEDEYGSIISKIIQLLEFRIPYYVGPLKPSDNSFSWVVRLKKDKVYPWNLDEQVDLKASSIQFIKRMTNSCSYLFGEDVLPKCSLLFSKYQVLNELNKLRINDTIVSTDIKHKLFFDLFLQEEKEINKKRIVDFFKNNNLGEINYDMLSGVDFPFKSNLRSYQVLRNIFDIKDLLDESSKEYEISEYLIFLHTIHSNSQYVIDSLKDKYHDIITEEQYKKIKGLSFAGWSSLSRKLLNGISIEQNAQSKTILDFIWETNKDLMQILYDYNFNEVIDEINNFEPIKHLTYQSVQDSYLSPMVKRSTWQALKIIKELEHILNSKPDKVFIEVTRKDEAKKKTDSRYEIIDNLFKKSKEISSELIEELESTKNESNNLSLKSERIYLYFLQMGKCAYSGLPIDLKNIFNTNLFDVDHIYPQSKIKDDSFNNKVLVLRDINQNIKKDIYPVDLEIQHKMKPFWTVLKRSGLMSDEKYYRLIRKTQLTDDELKAFISRQLTSTNQSVKGVIDILRKYYPEEVEIVFSKASLVSEFRNEYDMLKNREINDFHHAKDAYLNCVVGGVYHKYFDFKKYWTNKQSNNFTKLFSRKLGDYWDNTIHLPVVRNYANNQQDCFVTYMPVEGKGDFYDQTIYSVKSSNLFMRNAAMVDTKKYGGFKGIKNAYCAIVESGSNKKKSIDLIWIPVIYSKLLYNNPKGIEDYFGLTSVKIIKAKILKNTLIERDGKLFYLKGISTNTTTIANAFQPIIKYHISSYIKHICNFIGVSKNSTTKQSSKIAYLQNKYNDSKFSNIIKLSYNQKDKEERITLSKESNYLVYDFIEEYLKKNKMFNTFNNLSFKLSENRESFTNKTLLQQLIALFDYLNAIRLHQLVIEINEIFSVNSTLKFSNILTNHSFVIINQSVTGYFSTKEVINTHVVQNNNNK